MTDTVEKPLWLQAVKKAGDGTRDPKSFLIYGPHGTRKTSFAKSLADVKNADGTFRFPKILFIDVDDGTEVIEKSYQGRIDIVAVRTAGQIRAITEDLKRTDLGYDAVVWDTVDYAQDLIEAELTESTTNGWERWDNILAWTTGLLRTLHANPSYLGVSIAHSETKKAKTGEVREIPKLSGKSSREVGSVPSTVLYTEFDDEGEHITWLGGSNKLDAKNRYGLPNSGKDLNFVKLFNLIDKNINGEEN